MTIFECYNNTKKLLKKAGIEDYTFEAKQIVKYITKLSSSEILTKYNETLSPVQSALWTAIMKQRSERFPLQYILGEWSFYGLDFYVGEGCLVPRADTETLVDAVFEKIKENRVKTVLDLCTGSGCIGITVGKRYPETEVTLVEKYDTPCHYAQKNIERNGTKNVKLIKADIFDFEPKDKFDMIVSNPPYIPADEMETVDEETKREPDTALYGGESGMDYYVCILSRYLNYLNDGGFLAVEIGYGKEKTVTELFSQFGLHDVKVMDDLNGVARVVIGTYKQL